MSNSKKESSEAVLLNEHRGPLNSSALQWFIAILITAVLFAGVLWDNDVYFVTNDDASILKTYAGMAWGTPSPRHKFCNYCFGMLMASLYRAVPSIQWYTYTHFAMLFLSCAAILKSIMAAMARRNRSVTLYIPICLSLALISFAHNIRNLQFTTTSGIAVGAGIVLFLSATYEKNTASRIISGFICAFLVLMGYGMRPSMGRGMLVYVIPVMLFKIVAYAIECEHSFKKFLKKMVVPVCFVLVIAALLSGMKSVNVNNQTVEELDSFKEYSKYRVKYIDYPSLTYQDDPEFFQSIGWTEELYNATRNWYFLDSRYNAKTLKAITDRYTVSDKYTSDRSIETIAGRLKPAVLQNHQGYALTCLNVVLLGLSVIAFLKRMLILCFKNREKYTYMPAAFILCLCTVAGTVFVCFYLGYQGRFLSRVYYPFAITNAALLAVLLSEFPDLTEGLLRRDKTKINVYSCTTRVAYTCILLAVLTVFTLVPMRKTVIADGASEATSRYKANILNEVTEYVSEHKNNVYVYSVALSADYRTYLHGECFPGNMWGGSNMFSRSFYNSIEKHFGLTSIDTYTLLNVNMYIILAESESWWGSVIMQYFNSLGDVRCVEYDALDCGVKIMKLVEK